MKGPPVPISTDFYLSILAAKAVLPPILLVVRPHAEGGAVEGLGVPLHAGAKKDDLGKPMERGIYALSTPDQKTVLKLRVFAKEESGFDTEAMLQSPLARDLDPEIRGRIAATWTILQLTFESYDPKLYPALDFMLHVASRLAYLTDGVVADPLAGQFRMPESLPTPRTEKEEFSIFDFVNIQSDTFPEGVTLRTAGLIKFSHKEVCVAEVPPSLINTAASLLISVAAGVLKGHPLEPGNDIVALGQWIVGESAYEEISPGISRYLELLPLKGTVADQLNTAQS